MPECGTICVSLKVVLITVFSCQPISKYDNIQKSHICQKVSKIQLLITHLILKHTAMLIYVQSPLYCTDRQHWKVLRNRNKKNYTLLSNYRE